MYNNIAYLLKETVSHDEYGNEVQTTEKREVYCKVSSIGMSEHYQAAVADISPELRITLPYASDYEGEKLVEVLGYDDTFSVVRTYISGSTIEITLERRLGNGS